MTARTGDAPSPGLGTTGQAEPSGVQGSLPAHVVREGLWLLTDVHGAIVAAPERLGGMAGVAWYLMRHYRDKNRLLTVEQYVAGDHWRTWTKDETEVVLAGALYAHTCYRGTVPFDETCVLCGVQLASPTEAA